MRWSAMYVAGMLTLALAGGACTTERAGEGGENGATPSEAKGGAAGSDAMTVSGCLTGGADGKGFMLTANRPATGGSVARAAQGDAAETYTYMLEGANDLGEHVGQQVEVLGEIEARDDVEMTTREKGQDAPTTRADGEKVTPTVESKQEIELEIRRMTVQSVRPLGRPCESMR